MGEFYARTPLASHLDKEFEKIPESGSELAEKVNSIAMEIKNTRDEKKKQKLFTFKVQLQQILN